MQPVTPEQVRAELSRFGSMLDDAASGALGPDVIHEAANVFNALVGGRIDITAEPRASRQRTNMVGRFTPSPYLALKHHSRMNLPEEPEPVIDMPVEVYLREPPRGDQYADRVYALRTTEQLSFNALAERLGITHGQALGAWRRWHDSRGLPVPDGSHFRRGRPRKGSTPPNPATEQ